MAFDLAIKGGHVVDGAGNPWFRADVGVREGQIVAVGRLGGARAGTVVDAEGLVVAPGFVDMHAHSDLALLTDPAHEAKVRQGVTLEVIGQDGLGYAPATADVLADLAERLRGWNGLPDGLEWSWRSVADYLDRFDGGVAVNVAYLVPHGTIRLGVVGAEDRAATSAELDAMRRLVSEGMRDGAVGLSAGLTYVPGRFATDEELIALCAVMKGTTGFYCPHHRNYGSRAMEGYRDSIAIAESAGVPVHLAHCHLGFAVNRGRAPELLAMIDEARARGVDVTLDSYPYLAGSTYLHAYLPSWVQAGGRERLRARLRDLSLRARIGRELEETGSDGFHGVPIDWAIVTISGVSRRESRRWVGMTVAEAAAASGLEPVDFYCELLLDDDFGVSCVSHFGNEDNVRAIMRYPAHMAGSDGILVGDRPHPRGWGTMPRYLGAYARDLGLFRLEEIVRKLTSLPAQRLGMLDRGLVRPGMAADIVCFDPERVRDRATYEEPRQRPEGIPHVIVNGHVALLDGALTGTTAGRSVRSPGAKRRR